MAWRSREEREEPTEIQFEYVLRKTPKAYVFMIEGDEHLIAQSQIENEDVIERFHNGTQEEDDNKFVIVPKWLAVDNGWREWDD